MQCAEDLANHLNGKASSQKMGESHHFLYKGYFLGNILSKKYF